MKTNRDDPRLTTYLLGELPPEDATRLEGELASDHSLRAALGETDRMCVELRGLFGKADDRLLPRHRENIRKAAKEAARGGRIEILDSHRHTRKVWQVPLAAAAAIGAGIFLLTMIPSTKSGGNKPVSTKITDPSPDATSLEEIAREGNLMRLPLEAGKRSLSRITTAVRSEDRMPTQDEVRIAELLNAFPLKATGSAALWKGCLLSAEILPCPWRPSGNLVLVSLQGARDGERKVSVSFKGNADSPANHSVLGYSIAAGAANRPAAESTLPASGTVVLMIETSGSGKEIGSLVWAVDGTEAPPVGLTFDPEREPSDDATFATLISGFGLWLRGEGKPSIDDLLILALAREAAAESLVADRYDFITLVDQAVKISSE